MAEIIKEAKTVESAIAAALKELNCREEEVIIDVLQQPVKGIFGMAKKARVKVNYINANVEEEYQADKNKEEEKAEIEVKETSELEKEGKKVLQKMLSLMGFQTEIVKSKIEDDNIYLGVQSDYEGILIGKHGQTVAAIQYLVNRMLKDETSKEARYIVDIGSYRVRHKNILEKMAQKVANRVIESKQEEALRPMSALDRRIIHIALKENQSVDTYSTGESQSRHIVIAPNPDQ